MARNVLVTALATLAIGAAALGTSAPAFAWTPIPKLPVKVPIVKPFPKPGPAKPGPIISGGYGYGHKHYGGAGLAFGLMGGLALAAASASAEDCYLVRKRFVTEDGDLIVRRVRVCE